MKLIKKVVLFVLLVLLFETNIQVFANSQQMVMSTPPPSIVGPSTPRIGGHTTNLKFNHQAYRALGCFKDEADNRMFRGNLAYLQRQNSNKNCVDFCKRLNFVYAGTQGG